MVTQQLMSVKPQDSILAFECIAQGFSLAYGTMSGDIVCEKSVDGFSAKHQLIQYMHACHEEFGKPQALACAIGPGSFTGLRVASVAARSVAWALDIPVFGIDSLTALALAQGPGKWLCLLPLKRDTTFVAAYHVRSDGIETHYPCTAILDKDTPSLPVNESFTAIGPALSSKPELVKNWGLNCQVSTDENQHTHPHARDILTACRHSSPQAWQDILPAYFQASAPELQRQEKANMQDKKIS